MDEQTRQRALNALQYLFGVGILVWLAVSVDWGETVRLTRQLEAATLVGVGAVSLLNVGLLAVLWRPLLGSRPVPTYLDLLRVDLSVKFVNVLLPSRIGGRAAAPLILQRIGDVEWSDSVAVAGLHTGLYAVCYGAVCIVGLAVVAGRLGPGVFGLLVVATLGYLIAGTAILLVGIGADRILEQVSPPGTAGRWFPAVGRPALDAIRSIGSTVAGSSELFRERLSDPVAVSGFAVVWIGAVVLLPGIRFWLLLEGLTPDHVPLLPVVLVLVTAYSVTVLPLTPGGIGVTEASSTLVFVALGYPEAAVVPALFLDRLIGVYLPSMSGWLPVVRLDLLDRQSSDREGIKEKG